MAVIEHQTPDSLAARPRASQSRARARTPDTIDSPEKLSLVKIAATAAEDLMDLLSSQISLARVELAADVKASITRAVRLLLFVPVLLGGYIFAMATMAAALSHIWGWTIAFGSVALLQFLLGGIGTAVTMRRLSASKALARASSDAADNVRLTLSAVSSAVEKSRV